MELPGSAKSSRRQDNLKHKREAPKTGKVYPSHGNLMKQQLKNLELSKVEDATQSNLFISSDGEQIGQTLNTLNS